MVSFNSNVSHYQRVNNAKKMVNFGAQITGARPQEVSTFPLVILQFVEVMAHLVR